MDQLVIAGRNFNSRLLVGTGKFASNRAMVEALERETGARALRAVAEEIMLDIMYQVPSMPETDELVISRDVVEHRIQPLTGVRKKVS